MSETIEVIELGNEEYQVQVGEGPAKTSHRVKVPRTYGVQLTGGRLPDAELVRESFEFLLEREPKESILGSFELSVIGRYFPDYEEEIRRRVG